MIRAHTGARTREAEAGLLAAGQGPALMQRAAYALAQAAISSMPSVYGSRITVLVGSGNNGGDGLYAGVQLLRRGARVEAILCGPRAHPEALSTFTRFGGLVHPIGTGAGRLGVRARGSDLIIDAILGTGARPGLCGPRAELVRTLCGHGRVIAADVPSGLDPDTGEVAGPVLPAHATVSFGSVKAGLLLPPGEYYGGQIRCVDLGLPLGDPQLLRFDRPSLAAHWPWPSHFDHKYSRGVLGVVAGSARYPGAAQLALQGALAAGVGLVRYFGPIASGLAPEVVHGSGTLSCAPVDAWLVGPGVADDEQQLSRCREAIASGMPALVDAGAFEVLTGRLPASVILTPHMGELRRLLAGCGWDVSGDELMARPLHYARQLSTRLGATVLLKGASTIVVDPAGPAYSQSEGIGWLATAGSGDTLAGIIGALLAAGMRPVEAAAMGASVHGLASVEAAGPGHGGPITAIALARAVPGVIAALPRDEVSGRCRDEGPQLSYALAAAQLSPKYRTVAHKLVPTTVTPTDPKDPSCS